MRRLGDSGKTAALLEINQNLFDSLIASHKRQADFPPEYVKAVIHVGSGFNPDFVGNLGEKGLFPLLPDIAKALGFDPEDLHVAGVSIKAGVAYLGWLADEISIQIQTPVHPLLKIWLALFGYTAGPTLLRKALGRFRKDEKYLRDPGRFFEMVNSLKEDPLTKDLEKAEPGFFDTRKKTVKKYQELSGKYAKDFGREPLKEASDLTYAILGMTLLNLWLQFSSLRRNRDAEEERQYWESRREVRR